MTDFLNMWGEGSYRLLQSKNGTDQNVKLIPAG